MMIGLESVMRAAAVGAVALLLVAPPSAGQERQHTTASMLTASPRPTPRITLSCK